MPDTRSTETRRPDSSHPDPSIFDSHQPEGPDPTVLVLAGGLSHERDVSLRSGRRVSLALRSRGIEVIEADVDSSLVSRLTNADGTVVFPLLHGEAGEDGSL